MDATIINVECYVFVSKIQPKCVTAYACRGALPANAPLSLANGDPCRSLTSSDALAKLVVAELHEYASRLISELCQHGALILVDDIACARAKLRNRDTIAILSAFSPAGQCCQGGRFLRPKETGVIEAQARSHIRWRRVSASAVSGIPARRTSSSFLQRGCGHCLILSCSSENQRRQTPGCEARTVAGSREAIFPTSYISR